MQQSFKRFAGVWLTVLLGAFAPQAFAQATYYTNSDNENNAGTHVADNDMDVSLGNVSGIHPIEFNINVATLPQSSVVLSMRALDVDEEDGEVDQVYLNGHYLGRLTGANNVWSVTAFNVDPAWLVAGQNLVRVDVDTSGDFTQWVTTIDWAQMLTDGGGATDGDTRSVQITGTSVVASNVTINTSTSVHSITGGDYRLQITLIDPNGNAVTVLTQDFNVAAGADVTRLAERFIRWRASRARTPSRRSFSGSILRRGISPCSRTSPSRSSRTPRTWREQLQQRQRRRRVARQPGNHARHRSERCGYGRRRHQRRR